MLGGTRVIYPANQKQVTISVNNTDKNDSFLVQSWVENSAGEKSQDFVSTPPLYVSAPGNENKLRLMYIGKSPRKDKESLYYFNAKAIPSIDKKLVKEKNILLLAAITRIKIFVRPEGLNPDINEAPKKLTFKKNGNEIKINNPTPYYITLANMKIEGRRLSDAMVPPLSSINIPNTSKSGRTISFRTINDYGAATPEILTALQ